MSCTLIVTDSPALADSKKELCHSDMCLCFHRPLYPDEVLHTSPRELNVFFKDGLVRRRLDRILVDRPLQALLAEALSHFPVYAFMSLGITINVDLLEIIKVSAC